MGVQCGNISIASLLFTDDVVPLAPSDCDLQQPLGWFAKDHDMVPIWLVLDCSLWMGSELLDRLKRSQYFVVLFTS